jgi:hypothetical protein
MDQISAANTNSLESTNKCQQNKKANKIFSFIAFQNFTGVPAATSMTQRAVQLID